MTEDTHPKDNGDGRADIGSLGEEAAKLFAAATEWARQQTGDPKPASSPIPKFGELLSQEHIATGAPECRWCPICQAISLLRTTSPDVKEHVASLVVVARQILDAVGEAVAEGGPQSKPHPEPKPDVEHIDLSEDDPWD
jgi:hypothetical protein